MEKIRRIVDVDFMKFIKYKILNKFINHENLDCMWVKTDMISF